MRPVARSRGRVTSVASAPPRGKGAPESEATPPRSRYVRHWIGGGAPELVIGVLVVTALGLWCRVKGLTHGSLYRDDAWVALTSRVPWHDAWRMVGTAPGFVLFERFWVGLVAPSTWSEQIPTLVASVVAIPVVAAVAWWWGLRKWTVVIVTLLIAIGRINVEYATHLKPYATDVIAGALTLWGAERFRRGKSAWPFAVVAVVGLAVSFSVAPVVAGGAVVMAVEGLRKRRLGSLWGPGLLVAVPIGLLYWRVRGGISPQLKKSWAANFFDLHSLHAFAHSVQSIFSGLVWGFTDTTPHFHVPGLSKAIIAGVLVACAIGALTLRRSAVPLAGVVAAVVASAAQLEPLGTGRTDAYLYPAIALLFALGIEVVGDLAGNVVQVGRPVVTVLVLAAVLFLAVDVADHRPTYPGGSITPVAQLARTELHSHGGVIIEGTARWPWTLYEEHPVHLVFSPLYNTGFAPVSTTPGVYIMPGSEIEGGYDPVTAVDAVSRYHQVLYVRTDDWPTLGDPLRAALTRAGYCEFQHAHPAGYLLVWWRTTGCATSPKT